jgi:MFS transporter, DHA1 family, tetracycline resistance protein
VDPTVSRRQVRTYSLITSSISVAGPHTPPLMKRSPLIILFITVVIDLLGFGIILPLLPLYVKQFGGSPIVAGFLTTSFSLMQFIFSPIWGRASDLYGRRPLILLSLFGSTVAFLIFGLANSLAVLFLARIAGGILTAASLPTSQAYIADVTPPEKRARGMALIGVAFGIGFAAGPIIGGWLGRYGLHAPAFFVAGISFLNFVWSYFALPETHTTERDEAHARKVELFNPRRFADAFRTPVLSELLTVFSVSTFAFAMLEATFTWLILLRFMNVTPVGGHLTEEMARQAAPLVTPVFAIVGITIFIVQGAMMSGMAHRLGERRLIRVGAIILAVTMWGIGSATSMGILMVWSALVAVGSGILNPSLSSLISQASDPRDRGATMGVQQSLGSFARMIAPPLGTAMLIPGFGVRFGFPYYVAAVLMFVAFILSINIKRPRTTHSSEPTVPGP